MSFRQSRLYKPVMWTLTLACLGGAGYLGYQSFFAGNSPAKQLKLANDAYNRGVEAYGQKNWGEAATRFDEAQLLADKTLDAWKVQVEAKRLPPDQMQELHCRAMWVKAHALRDRAYAKAQVENKPLPEVPDSQYNESFRSFAVIPDGDARLAARNALRGAYATIGADDEFAKSVVKEVVRLEVIFPQPDWKFLEPALRKARELNPNDARANYYLARFEYEQPGDDFVTPTPLAKRSAERVEKARELLAAAKKAGAPFWRVAGLEAEILDWPVRTAAERKVKPEAAATAAREVDGFLFDGPGAAVAAAGRGDHFASIGAADATGLVSVLTVGAERGFADAVRPGGTADRLKQVVRAALDAAGKLADAEATKPALAAVAPGVVNVLAGAQVRLLRADPAAWRDAAAGLGAVLAKAPAEVKQNPQVLLKLAQMTTVEAYATTAAEPRKELLARAVKELEEGLQGAEAARAPAAEIDEFHAELAERKLELAMKGEEVEPHLARLRASALPRARLLAQLLDGVVAERQGRLEKARKALQPLAADKANPDLAMRANVLLAGLTSAVGDWAAALGALKDVEARYGTPDGTDRTGLWTRARAVADAQFGGPDGIAAVLVGANLRVAAALIDRHLRESPGKPVPRELVSGYESAAEALAKKLRSPSPADRTARLALTAYLLRTGRAKDAENRLDALALDYPDNVEVLRARCLVLAAPADPKAPSNPNGVAAADLLIRKFVKDYPASTPARLFQAEWWLRTGRGERAVEYLNDPASFPNGRDAAVDQLLAQALLQTGQSDEARKVLNRLPSDPILDALLIQAATTREAGAQQLKDALSKYENRGLLRLYEASVLLGERKLEEAVRGFAGAIEFTQVAPAARVRLQQALAAFAEVEPAKARALALALSADLPDEPGVYLGAAVAAIYMDDIGAPADRWDATKTMYAAVNRWEAAALKAGTPPPDVAIVKAQFRLAGGDVAGARQEVTAGLARSPKHLPLLIVLAEFALAPPADVARAREYLAAATAESPADPRLPLVDAAIRLAAGDPAGAAAVYEKLVAETPRSATLHARLVAALEAAGRKDDALRRAREWAEQVPADNAAAATLIRLLAAAGQKDEAEKVADDLPARRAKEVRARATSLVPPPAPAEVDRAADRARAAALMAAAQGFFRAGAFAAAEARAAEALKTAPDPDRVQLVLGDLAIARKDWDRAVAIYAGLLKKNPRHFLAGNNLAWILVEAKNDPAAALAIVQEVRKARDGDRPVGAERLHPDFLDTIGLIYGKLNRPDLSPEMRATFEAAVRRYPADPRMQLYLAQALAANGERSRALEAVDAAAQLARAKNGLPDDQNKAVLTAADALKAKLKK